MSARTGPPRKERPGGLGTAGSNQKSAEAPPTTNTTDPNRPGRLCGTDTVSQLRRRRHASWRLPSLQCGCRDPSPCRCTDPSLSERQVDYWRDAAVHVLSTGCMPLVPLEARRALWRRGGADRVLAKLLHDVCGGEAA